MNETILEKMGGERTCTVCGYVEREVYRLFCPRCMQRDRLSPLTTRDAADLPLPVPLEPPGAAPGEGVPLQ